MRMQHVITLEDLTFVHVILDTVVMDLYAMVNIYARHEYKAGNDRNIYL